MTRPYSYDRTARLAAKDSTELNPKSLDALEKIGEDCTKMRKQLQKQIEAVTKLQAKYMAGSRRFPPNPKEKYDRWFEEALKSLALAENQLMVGEGLRHLPYNLKLDMDSFVG